MPNIKHIGVSLLVVTLSSCASFKDYEAPKAPEGLDKEILSQEGTPYDASEPVVRWWQEFNDPKLTQLIEQALVKNHDIRIAAANLAIARASTQGNKANYWPSTTFDADSTQYYLTEEGLSGVPTDRSIGLHNTAINAAWELDIFGRVSNGVKAAKAQQETSLAQLNASNVAVTAEVASQYFALRGAQLRLDIANRNATNQQKTFELTQTLRNGGRANAVDVARAQTQLSITQASIPPLEADVNAAIYRLSVLVGELPSNLIEPLEKKQPLPSLPTAVAVGDASELLKRRPDVIAAERQLAASFAEYNLAVSQMFPSVSIAGSIGFSSTDFGSFDGSAVNSAIGPSLSIPLLNFGKIRAGIDQADANTLATLARYEQTVLNALQETQTALSDFTREHQRRDTLQQAAKSALEASELAQIRFNQGVDGFLDVLDAQRTLLETEDALALSEINTALDLISIYRALAGGWYQPQSNS